MNDTTDRENERITGLPEPSQQFRRHAWQQFQRALDPLATPRPLPPTRRGRP